MKNKTVLVLALITVLALGGSYSLYEASANAAFVPEQEAIGHYIDIVGEYFRANRDLIFSGMNYKADIPEGKVAFQVNGIPVSNDELQMRLGINKATGSKIQTIDDMRDMLIREQVFEENAKQLNLLPSEAEVDTHLQKRKAMANNDPAIKFIVEKSILEWGLTEEEYWNVYERYHAYRYLILDKLGRHLTPDFYNKDRITYDDEKAAKEQWDAYFEKQISEAVITVN